LSGENIKGAFCSFFDIEQQLVFVTGKGKAKANIN
jgi:hypothetical protein